MLATTLLCWRAMVDAVDAEQMRMPGAAAHSDEELAACARGRSYASSRRASYATSSTVLPSGSLRNTPRQPIHEKSSIR